MDQSDLNRAEINGAPADLEAFRYLALVNYGHFTSMQVRDRRARGFHLHLERLNRSTQELFGHELDPTIVRDWIRHLLREDLSAVSLRVPVFSRSLHFDALAVPATPDVLITVRAPVVAALTPLRVQSMRYERVLPHIKHIGTLDLFHHTRQAQKNGYDDVIFTTTKDTISEGSIWNVVFFDGSRVVWTSAPMLAGISMQLLCAGLERQGIP